jgi:hypothetical protein
MARETSIKYEFLLEQSRNTKAIILVADTPVTAGNPTVLKIDPADPGWAAGDYAVGGILFIDGTGWAELDGMVHTIVSTTPLSGTINIDTDTTGVTTPLGDDADIVIQSFVWMEVCLSEFTPNPGTPGEVDVTTMCDVERRNLPGLPTPGTASFTGMFDLTDDGMKALIAAQKDALSRYFVGVSRRGQSAVFHGVVSSFSIGALTVEAALTYTGTFTLDESPYYFTNAMLAAA